MCPLKTSVAKVMEIEKRYSLAAGFWANAPKRIICLLLTTNKSEWQLKGYIGLFPGRAIDLDGPSIASTFK
jgi:hypothetical protein